jgi:trehalose synthase
VPPEPAAIPVASASIAPFRDLLEPPEWERFRRTMAEGVSLLQKRRLWNINSTAHGGGVAEMLAWQIPYERNAGMDVRWLVIEGDPEFFAFTKRLHALLHGISADGSEISAAERDCYEQTAAANAAALDRLIDGGDLVIVHDPQPAGLIPALVRRGCRVIWRCHIGVDAPNTLSKGAWDFLRPWIGPAHAYVFSRRAYVWEGLDPSRVEVIPPAIDAFSPKNAEMAPPTAAAVLHAAGILQAGRDGEPAFRARDGSPKRVERRAQLLPDAELPVDAPVVVQVSRWDRLKDPVGVLEGFAMIVEAQAVGAGHLVLAGPGTSSVADDPEEKAVLRDVEDAWRGLPARAQGRIHLVRLPMDDQDENAAIVNALQRRAEVVVQKSLREGFGLTVAEAMWKSRPVVASRVGGIQDQIENGKNGVLVDDPQDLAAFGTAVAGLLSDRSVAERLGAAAKRRVQQEFLAPRLLMQHVQLARTLLRSAD